jgi:hypothetical protein
MEAAPLFFTTLALTGGLSYLLTKSYRQEIMAHWDERRCELPVMVMAGTFKPPDDTRSDSDFANDNFSFCSRMMAMSLFKIMLAPVLVLIGKQIDITSTLDQSTNIIRIMMSNLMDTFQKILDPFYRRFLLIGRHFANGFRKLMSAMERIFGIAVAAIFMGISATRASLNAVDFVIKVVIIIMGILIGIFILLFFVLFPLTPVIMSTLAVLAAVGIGVAGSGVFCFDPQTQVCMADGSTKPIANIRVGEKLLGNDSVIGVLLTEKEPNTAMYDYKGIFVSGSHIVWEEGEWKPVEESRFAIPMPYPGQRLYSLRTASRTMTVHNNVFGTTVLFRDWEEIEEGIPDAEWDVLVQTLLSNSLVDDSPSEEDPCFSAQCKVWKNGNLVSIGTIRIGDVIADKENTTTKVIGVYTGLTSIAKKDIKNAWHTDGVWWKETNWTHRPVDRDELALTQGVHVVTESGTFWIQTNNHSGIVRDFTEVGHTHLPQTMDFLLRRLNEKPKA